jgi:GT2 family glycosyltransferase
VREHLKLSVVILNHNSGSMLVECIDSLFADDLPFEFEVIVPDNVSTDDSLALAEQKWGERIQIIPTGANRGFSWGNNIGIRASKGEFVCLLNPDTIVHSGCFKTLIEFMDSHPKAACSGPKVYNSDGSHQLSAKRMIPSPWDAVSRALLLSKIFPKSKLMARYNVTYLDPEATQHVDASAGCCMLLRRQVLDEIGLFDDGYFIYCEDVDWFMRAKKAGWEVWYVSDAVIEHHHAYSAKFRKRRAVRDFHDSMIRFYRKHYAEEYPKLLNGLMYLGVRARMYLIMCTRTITGWG